MTVKIENMKHQGAQARVLCSEARCPNVSKTGDDLATAKQQWHLIRRRREAIQ